MERAIEGGQKEKLFWVSILGFLALQSSMLGEESIISTGMSKKGGKYLSNGFVTGGSKQG